MGNDFAELQGFIADAVKSDEVKGALKSAVCEAVKSQMDEFGRGSFVERQRTVKENALLKTEKLLYGYRALEQHLASEEEYMAMALKESSGSVVRYQKNKADKPQIDQILAERKRSYLHSLDCFERLKNALDKVSGKKGFEIIRMKYLSEEDYTYGEIARLLAGAHGFSSKLNEKTVRKYKNNLVSEIAVYLYGTDAL